MAKSKIISIISEIYKNTKSDTIKKKIKNIFVVGNVHVSVGALMHLKNGTEFKKGLKFDQQIRFSVSIFLAMSLF